MAGLEVVDAIFPAIFMALLPPLFDMTHLVLLTIDCLRYDRCGFNGWHRNTTPFLDQIAKESVVFDRAYAPGSQTSESFPGILGGRLSHNNATEYSYGIADAGRIQKGHSTIADHLQAEDMTTVAAVSNPSLSSHAGFDTGFQEFLNLRIGESSSEDENEDSNSGQSLFDFGSLSAELLSKFKSTALSGEATGLHYRLPFIAYRFAQLRDWPTVDGAAVVSDLSDKMIHAAKGNQSVFAWGHLNDLHAPLHPDKVKSGDLFTGSSRDLFDADYRRLTQQFSPNYNAAYESVLRYIDDQIKQLVEDLQDAGLWDETILVVTADHGEALSDHGYYGHPPHYLFNDCLHVPLLVRTSEINRTRVSAPFSLAWLHELIADLLDVSRFDLPETSDRSSHIENPEQSTVVADSLTGIGYSVSFINEDEKYVRFVEDIDSILDQHYTTEWLRDLRETITWGWAKGVGYNLTFDPGEQNPTDPTFMRSQYEEMAAELAELRR